MRQLRRFFRIAAHTGSDTWHRVVATVDGVSEKEKDLAMMAGSFL